MEKRVKKKYQKIYVEEHFIKMIKELINADKEIGGGITINKRTKKIEKIEIFPSKNRDNITFYKIYDVEFHTHPSNKDDKYDVLLSRIPSAGDIASILVTGRDEIIFSRGYIFKIGFKNRDIIRKIKYRITRETNKRNEKYASDFEKFYNYFYDIENNLCKISKKETDDKIKFIRNYTRKWKKALSENDILITQIKLKEAKVNVI